MKTALITGISGQGGAYLSQLLLTNGYRVVGLVRRSSNADKAVERLRWLGLEREVELVDGDLTDLSSPICVLAKLRPDEIHNLSTQNLSTQSFVALSWQQPILTSEVTGMGAFNMLEHNPFRLAHILRL
jgi:GDPmannose 4,6-dehydratase